MLRTLRSALTGVITGVKSVFVTPHPNPVFILGNQKSGTTAIAALLAEYTGTGAALDLRKEMRNPTFHRVSAGSLSITDFVLANKLEFSRPIIKEPNLSVLYEKLAARFTDSRFVMIIRDPRDNIRSILNRLDLPGSLADLEPSHLDRLSETWRLIIDGSWLGLTGGNYVDRLAARWNYITNVYLQNSKRITLVRYEDFLGDKVGTISRLADGLGLPARRNIEDRVDIQYQPAGDHSVRWLDFFGEANLRRIETRCRDDMRALGYAPSL